VTFPGFPQAPQQPFGGFGQPAPQAPQQFGGFPQQPQQQQAYGNGYPQQPAPAAPQQPAAPQSFSDPNSFLMGGGIPAAQFPTVGAVVSGTVEDLEVQQQRDLDTNALLFWDDGRPREQLVVTLATAERDPQNPLDDGRRKLYCKGGSMPQAIAKACRAAGHPEGLAIGGQLAVQYVGDGEAKKRGYNPPKQYAAQYQAPDPAAGANAALMGGTLEQQQPAAVVSLPTPQAVQQAPAGSYGYLPTPQAVQQQPAGFGQPQVPGVAVNGGVDFGQMLAGQQQVQQQVPAPAPAGPVIPDGLPPQVRAALEVLPPEQIAAALAQMGLAPQQAPAA
jgi:hypothetical protein